MNVPQSPPPRKHRVAVTGLGIVSPLGRGTAETRVGLFENPQYCGREVTQFSVSQTRCKSAAVVERRLLSDLLPISKRSRQPHTTSLMMAAAMREALESAGNSPHPELCVIGTTSGGMTNGESFFRSLCEKTGKRLRAHAVANYMPQKPVMDAMEHCGLRMPLQLVANACASGSNAVGMGWNLIRNGSARCVMTGGYDGLSELVFVGFDCLHAATPEICRPFDKDRSGLILGEAAAVLILENMDDAIARGAQIYAELAGYGITTDNHHLTQPHPSGCAVKAAMQQALKATETPPEEVDYINAHGTATPFNDATEGVAISELCRAGVGVSSTKSMIGHTLGAAGAVEAIFSVMSLSENRIPPNLNFRAGDPDWTFEVVTTSRSAPLRSVLSNSLGFGGTNASLHFRKGQAA